MDLLLVTEAAAPLVSLDDAKAHLRVEHSQDDALIEALCEAATELIEGRQGWTRRAGGVQTWELRLDAFPCEREIELPLPPLRSVTFIKYLDVNDTEQTFSAANYTAHGRELFGEIELKWGSIWPVTSFQKSAVTIRFEAGYDIPPARMRQAALITIAALYANRGDNGAGDLPIAAERLLRPLRVSWPEVE